MHTKGESGQFFLEVLIGVAIIAIAIAGVSTALVVAVKGSENNIIRSAQASLLEEAFMAVNAMSSGSWNSIYNPLGTTNKGTANPYGVRLNSTNDAWELFTVTSPNYQQITLNGTTFTRRLTIDNVSRGAPAPCMQTDPIDLTYASACDDPTTQKITVTVSAPGSPDVAQTRYVSRYLNTVCIQTTWPSGNSGQAGPVTCPPTGFFSSSNITFVVNGSESDFRLTGSGTGTLESSTIDLGGSVSPLTITWEGTK